MAARNIHYVWKRVEPHTPSQTSSHLHHDRCASGLCPAPPSFSASSPGGVCFHRALFQTQDLPPTRLPPAAAGLMDYNGNLKYNLTSSIHPTIPSALPLGGAYCLLRPGLLTLNLCSNPDQKLICRGYIVLSIVPEGFGKWRLYLK